MKTVARTAFRGDNPPKYGGGFMGGSVQQDKRSGKYYIKFYDGGKQSTIYTDKFTNQSFMSEEHARKCKGIIQQEIDQGVFNKEEWKRQKGGAIQQKPTLKQYSKKWLNQREKLCAEGGIVKRTLKDDKTAVRRLVKHLGNKRIDKITKQDIEKLYNKLSLSNSGKYNTVSTLRKMLNDAVDEDVIIIVPDFLKMSKKSNAKKQYMIPEEQNLVISKIPAKDQPIFHFLRQYGLRPGEARAIHKTSIRNGEVHIEWAFSENELRNTTKTGEPRSYLITPFINDVIESIPENDFEFLCVRDDGKPYTSKNINKIWREACKTAGIPHFKLYNAMRHSLARNLLQQGFGFDMVAEVLGHASVEMTRSFYADMPMNKVRDALNGLSETQNWVGRETGR